MAKESGEIVFTSLALIVSKSAYISKGEVKTTLSFILMNYQSTYCTIPPFV